MFNKFCLKIILNGNNFNSFSAQSVQSDKVIFALNFSCILFMTNVIWSCSSPLIVFLNRKGLTNGVFHRKTSMLRIIPIAMLESIGLRIFHQRFRHCILGFHGLRATRDLLVNWVERVNSKWIHNWGTRKVDYSVSLFSLFSLQILYATIALTLWIKVEKDRNRTSCELAMNCGPDSSHFSGTSWSLSV